MTATHVVARPSQKAGQDVTARLLSSRALPAVAIVGASFLIGFAWILRTQLQRLYGLTAPGWDLGQGQQVLWSLANGHGWASSYEYGKNFLGIHIEPVFVPIAALEMIWPTAVVPLVVSAAGLAAMAPAGYLMFRSLLGERPGARWLALALAAPMPFWASTQEAARDQFHPENLAPALAMLAVWAGLRQRKLLLWLFVVAALSCKEDQVYAAFVIGLVVLRFGGESMKSHARRVMMLALSWLFIGVALLSKLAAGAATPGLIYYWWMIHGGTNYFLLAVSRPDPWLAVVGLLAGLLALPLLAPRWLLLALPPLAASLLSDHDPMERLQLHYSLIVMFPVIVAAGIGARRLLAARKLPAWLPAPALLCGALPALVIGWAAGRLPPALGAESWLYTQPDAVSRLLSATSVIPAGAPVTADDGAVVWLSNRTRVGVFYDSASNDTYVVIDRDAYAHRNDKVLGRAGAIARLQASGRPLLADDGRFQVWGPVPG
ncbi:MAG: DUF2079 domain-containing protein [Candidatus Dormibacterales bacterium]